MFHGDLDALPGHCLCLGIHRTGVGSLVFGIHYQLSGGMGAAKDTDHSRSVNADLMSDLGLVHPANVEPHYLGGLVIGHAS